jgi:hypothetical protein
MNAPSATPRRAKPPSNLGCIVAIVALPVVVFLGLVVGTALRGDDEEPEEEHVTLEGGELEGIEWQVDAVVDVQGETCVFLYEDGAADPLNGTCDLQPQDVTYGEQTVVFGRADAGDTTVTVELSSTDSVDIDTVSADGMAGRFYVEVVEGDVDAVALVG